MKSKSFEIKYPQINSGAGISNVYISDDAPDFISYFSAGQPRNDNTRYFFVTDATVASLDCMKEFTASFDDGVLGQDRLLILGSGEKYKTIESVLEIVKAAINENFSRNDCFVGIGGGVICDITAFAASIFKRGARVKLVPTTVLAMVDASMGGKTGCDFDNYKNMIGTFYPAKRLHVFSDFLQTLPPEEYRSGLAETLKTALLYAPKLFHIMQNQKDEVLARETELVRQIIRRCVIAKASIVEKDLTETGLRMQLNLGHTFAHALETTAGLGAIPHGDAVAWGIGRALELSVNLGLCEEEYRQEVDQVLESYGWCRTAYHPVLEGKVSPEEAGTVLLSAMKKDKKNSSTAVRFILQREINSTVIQEVPEDKILAVLEAKA